MNTNTREIAIKPPKRTQKLVVTNNPAQDNMNTPSQVVDVILEYRNKLTEKVEFAVVLYSL